MVCFRTQLQGGAHTCRSVDRVVRRSGHNNAQLARLQRTLLQLALSQILQFGPGSWRLDQTDHFGFLVDPLRAANTWATARAGWVLLDQLNSDAVIIADWGEMFEPISAIQVDLVLLQGYLSGLDLCDRVADRTVLDAHVLQPLAVLLNELADAMSGPRGLQ